MFDFQSPHFLRRILWLDTATCVATGLLMTVAAGPIAGLTQLPAPLLRYAGLSLLPVAAFIASVASRPMLPAAGVWLIIAGNFAWVAASLWLWLGAGDLGRSPVSRTLQARRRQATGG